MSLFHESAEVCELRRRLRKRELELEALHEVEAAARAVLARTDSAARTWLRGALDRYDRTESAWGYQVPAEATSLTSHLPLRPVLSHSPADRSGGWHRGGPHGRPARAA
ncbi:MAG: hypothetical protein U0R69_06600 [Gaiellales bacterium]